MLIDDNFKDILLRYSQKNQLTPEQIKNIMKEVYYPGFNRDIVSFGMLKDISIQDAQINISLQINSARRFEGQK